MFHLYYKLMKSIELTEAKTYMILPILYGNFRIISLLVNIHIRASYLSIELLKAFH